jgi:NAD(P)-dependent dehydrogenase (short-subunit alcohol dehydrogenase family)
MTKQLIKETRVPVPAKPGQPASHELAITWLNDRAWPYVEPLAQQLNASITGAVDVSTPGQLEAIFDRIRSDWGRLDILVHSIAFAPKEDLQGGRGVRQGDGHILPFLHPNGEAGHAADDKR